MFCQKCGKEILNSSVFCPNCGEKVIHPNIQETVYTQTSTPIQEKTPTPVGFILGLISIIAWILPLAGYPVTICGIVFSVRNMKTQVKSARTMAIVGLVLSIIFLIVTLFNSLLGVFLQFYFLESAI